MKCYFTSLLHFLSFNGCWRCQKGNSQRLMSNPWWNPLSTTYKCGIKLCLTGFNLKIKMSKNCCSLTMHDHIHDAHSLTVFRLRSRPGITCFSRLGTLKFLPPNPFPPHGSPNPLNVILNIFKVLKWVS